MSDENYRMFYRKPSQNPHTDWIELQQDFGYAAKGKRLGQKMREVAYLWSYGEIYIDYKVLAADKSRYKAIKYDERKI